MFLSFSEWDKKVVSETEIENVIRGYDEPDTSLHYNAQRRLFYDILNIVRQENSKIQAMICTHSLTMIDRARAKEIYFLKLDDNGISKIEYLQDDGDADIQTYLNEISIEMGLPNSSLFFERCFLIVEGATEEHTIPLLYNKKYTTTLIEDGINLVNAAKGFIKLLGKTRRNCLLFLLDNDCRNPDSQNSLTLEELLNLGFDNTFVNERVHYIGDKEFEDSFPNQIIIDCLNKFWSKKDGTPWNDEDINKIRNEDKFSDKLLHTIREQSGRKGIEICRKPIFGEKLALMCKVEDYPQILVRLFEKAREISQV